MNPLKFEQGIYRGEIPIPEPMEWADKWYEFFELRKPKSGDAYLYKDRLWLAMTDNEHRGDRIEYWIASPIPEPTPEQLRAIGMTCPAGRPMEVKEGDVIWTDGGQGQKVYTDMGCEYNVIGRYRFVLEKVEKESAKSKPAVVCLCGSTRFKDTFDEENRKATMCGKIVLSCGCWIRHDEKFKDKKLGEALDELHKRKIDLADEVLILNVGGYIGESTRSELEYAIAHGKQVRYLELVEKQSAPPPEVHTSCCGCVDESVSDALKPCYDCYGKSPRPDYTPKAKAEQPAEESNAILCNHANEVPNKCFCPPTCYCKQHTCKPAEARFSVGEIIEFLVLKNEEFKNYQSPEWGVCVRSLSITIADPTSGIAAVTRRGK